MKTKELIKKVKELGFEIIRAGSHIDIMFNDFIVAGVYTDQMHVMTFYSHEKLLLTNVDKLFNLLVEYAKTPVDKREEEKKFYFYLRHRWFTTEFSDKYYLCKCYNSVGDIKYAIKISYFMDNETWLFTLKEIEKIKEKFHTDLADFELVESGKNPGSVGRFDDLEYGKKYYLRAFLDGVDMNENYLNFSKSNRNYMLSDREDDSWHQTKFTKKDIIKLITCQKIDLDDFEIVEVEE